MSLNSLQILSNVLSVTTHHEINIVDGHLKQALVPDLTYRAVARSSQLVRPGLTLNTM